MRITLNLASKPFIELRPLYARLRWWMVLLLLLSMPLWFLLRFEQRRAEIANARLQAVTSAIQRLQNQQQNAQAMMRLPQNAAILTQADFLNGLFARKGFSWTAIMMDLETVLPGGVQVQNIDPAVDKSGNLSIRLRVSGPRERAVELIRNLEHSRRFQQPRLAAESAETNNGNGNQASLQPVSAASNVNFDILADYKPLAADGKRQTRRSNPEAAAAAPSSNPDSVRNTVRHSLSKAAVTPGGQAPGNLVRHGGQR